MKAIGQFLTLLLLVLLFTANNSYVTAKEGFYISAGGGNSTIAGDLNGMAYIYTPLSTPTDVFLLGKLSSNIGTSVKLGYGFTDSISVEVVSSNSKHTASHAFIVAGDSSSQVAVTTTFVNIKSSTRIAESAELFLRAGLGTQEIKLDKFWLKGYTSGSYFIITDQRPYTLSGQSSSLGVGVEFFIGNIGIELSYDVFGSSFNEIWTTSGYLPVFGGIKTSMSEAKASLAFHF